MLFDIFQQSGQAETIEAAEIGGQTETIQIDTTGTSSAPSVPPRPRGKPYGLIMISQAMCTEAMSRIGILEAKVHNIEGGVKPWVMHGW